MRWLIVEDALRDKRGHWFEYIRTFRNGVLQLGDEVTILSDRNAEPFIKDQLAAHAVLPSSIWHRMNDGAGLLLRYLRLPVHAWQTRQCMRNWFKKHDDYDIIFVPTVSVHHLLGWYWIIRDLRRKKHVRILLYFLSLPIKTTGNGEPYWAGSPTTHLIRWLFKRLQGLITSGRVILGVETEQLKRALETLAGVPVCHLAQPVEIFAQGAVSQSDGLLMACYGGARCEKGSELLQLAIAKYIDLYPQSRARFAIQWVEDFQNEQGAWVRIDQTLEKNKRVQFIREFFKEAEYARWMGETQVMLVPYQRSSYKLRGSRVVIEAMVHGIPVITTRGTTLADQTEKFGSVVFCEDGDIATVVDAIRTMEQNFLQLKVRAEQQKVKAREYFSVSEFRKTITVGIKMI